MGSAVGGLVYDSYGPRVLFYGCACLAGGGIALLALFRLAIRTCCSPSVSAQDSAADNADERSPLLSGDSRSVSPHNHSVQVPT